jgi:predicted nucleic acid-binding protein
LGRLKDVLGPRVYIDTNIIIYIVEGKDEFALILNALLEAITVSDITAVTSEIIIAETLVKPFKKSDERFQNAYKNFLAPSLNFEIVLVSRDILESSARIRATTKLKLPDTIHWATANRCNCDSFLTNDELFKTLSTDVVKFISDIHL